MTTRKATTPTLFNLKVSVIDHHKGDQNEYLRVSIARDACFTSFNSVDWKSDQMSTIKKDLSNMAEAAGSEVIDTRVGQKIFIYRKMEDELMELQERHKTDCDVYTHFTGEVWTRKPKRTGTSDLSGDKAELARILAS
tara:strand:+ start:695 stop:1108 length:414 start_codon:yes stop_codon:yes gene_type:complete